MKNHEIVFTLNKKEKIIVELMEPLVLIGCGQGVPIFFMQGSGKVKIDSDDMRWDMNSLSSLLTAALRNRLTLHESIKENIGYLYAQLVFYGFDRHMAKKQGLIFDEEDEWVGTKHLLFAYDIAIWIYNDQQGAIILEFTPWYKGNYFDFEGETDFTQYEQFLKDYKPLFTRTLPRDVAQQWLDQANSILKQITENSERFEKEGQRQGIN
jgi:hypothetical protein